MCFDPCPPSVEITQIHDKIFTITLFMIRGCAKDSLHIFAKFNTYDIREILGRAWALFSSYARDLYLMISLRRTIDEITVTSACSWGPYWGRFLSFTFHFARWQSWASDHNGITFIILRKKRTWNAYPAKIQFELLRLLLVLAQLQLWNCFREP